MMKILIIEDDASINKMITDYLQNHDYICKAAYSGSEAALLLKMSVFIVSS